MSYYTPDLTGSLPTYATANDIYTVFIPQQRICFDKPIFLTSLQVIRIGTVNTPMVQGVDWITTPAEDTDYTAMSRIMNGDPSFSQILIKSIEIISTAPQPYRIACSYQQLYPVPSSIAMSQIGMIELTPDLIINILQRLSVVETDIAGIPNVTAQSTITPKLLALDVNGTLSANIITEAQTVNVFQGQNVIRPTCGAFFANSVQITLSGSLLVPNVDYLVFGFDASMTRTTTNTSGVYNFILVLRSYTGSLSLTYHAYGGAVTLYDMNAVYQQLINVNQFLTSAQFLTGATLGTNLVVQSLLSRITTLETTMRNLINQGSPNYSDSTGNGTSGLWKLQSNDTNLHWWTVASLYTVAGSSQVITADRMHLRLQLQNAHLSADVFINVDTTLPNPFQIDAISVNQNLGYVPFTSYGTSPVCIPEFRIIYNTTLASPSGILLQIGLALPTLIETLSIQDLSGTESCWILMPPSGIINVLPMDGMVTLPNIAYVWDAVGSSSVQYSHMMPNDTGYLVWGGSVLLSTMNAVSPNMLNALLLPTFQISDIAKLRLEFTTTGTSPSLITLDIPVGSYIDHTTISGSGYIQNYPRDGTPVMFEVTIINTGTSFTLSVIPDHIPVSTGITLRHVIALFS